MGPPFNLYLFAGLVAGCGLLMLLERLGLPTTLQLPIKGDIKRESRFLAQYGQFVCTIVVAVLALQLDSDAHRHRQIAVTVAGTFLGTITSTIIKRLLGRARPGRPHAGHFLGPAWHHDNQRESFPSNHSAAAVALSVGLAMTYPQAAVTFWALALCCALLRYLLDAHWPSDILGGIAVGYGVAHGTVWLAVNVWPRWT